MISYSVYSYNYKDNISNNILNGSSRNCLSFMESYISNMVNHLTGGIDNLTSYIIPKPTNISKYDYKHNPIYITRSLNNISKLTINKISRSKGYVYNTYFTSKILTVYIFRNHKSNRTVHNKPRLQNKDLLDIYVVDKDIKDKYKLVIDQLVKNASN